MDQILSDSRGLRPEIRYQTGLIDTAGNPAHAATFIRQRLIILDEELLRNKTAHQRVLIHELLHFVWVRLGNQRRLDWEQLLSREWDARARGEMGWSAEWRKRLLTDADRKKRTQKWREYCCESFCDTGAWVYGADESEVTLAAGRRSRRKVWFANEFATGSLFI